VDLAIDERRIYEGAGQHCPIRVRKVKRVGKTEEWNVEGKTRMECRGMKKCSEGRMGKENG
jgi:hypothetical protein